MEYVKTILIVDDEPNTCAYLKDLLEYFRYEVVCAFTCKDAIIHLKQRPFDALLVDMNLKGECGETVLGWLRSIGRQDPVVMMSPMPNYEMRIDLIFKGAADLLGKPVQPTQLQAVLRKVLQPAAQPVVQFQRLADAMP